MNMTADMALGSVTKRIRARLPPTEVGASWENGERAVWWVRGCPAVGD
jgi:hypothetical protein